MPLVLFRSSITQDGRLGDDLAVVAADEAAVDLQVVVRRAADHQAAGAQRHFADRAALGRDDQPAERRIGRRARGARSLADIESGPRPAATDSWLERPVATWRCGRAAASSAARRVAKSGHCSSSIAACDVLDQHLVAVGGEGRHHRGVAQRVDQAWHAAGVAVQISAKVASSKICAAAGARDFEPVQDVGLRISSSDSAVR